MSSQQALFDGAKSLFDADTGVGGLGNVTGSQYVIGGFFRRGDPQRTSNIPSIEFAVAAEVERDSMPTGRVEAVVEFHVYTKRDLTFTQQNAIATRMRTVFHGAVPADQNGWKFSPLHRLRGVQAPAGDNLGHYVEQYGAVITR